jgi:hypothetical protein
MAEVGSAWVSVLPDARGFGSKLSKQVGGEVSSGGRGIGTKLGSAMKLGLAGAVVGAGVAAVSFIKGAMDEAREAQKVGALTVSTIKATGGAANITAAQVGKLSTALSLKTGIDDEAIQSGANMLLTFRNLRNESGKGNDVFNQATKTLTDLGAAMGKEPRSAAIQLGKALNDPVKGMSALSRVGVTFNDAQKKTITEMVNSGNVMGAQKVILKELNSEFGGAAEAQATAGDKLKVAWGNAQEAVGTALLPLVDKVMGSLTTIVIYLTNNVGPAFSAVSNFLAPLNALVSTFFASVTSNSGGTKSFLTTLITLGQAVAATVLPILQQLGAFFLTTLLPAITAVGGYLLGQLVPIWTTVARVVTTQLLPIVAALARFFVGVLLPAIFAIARSIASSLKPVFDALFQVIRTSILPAVQQLLAKFREWQPTLQKVVLIVVKVIGFVLRLAAAILGRVLPVVIRFAGLLIRLLFRAIVLVISIIVGIIKVLIRVGQAFGAAGAAVGRFVSVVKNKIAAAARTVGELGSRVKKAVSGFGGLLIHAGEALIGGLITGIGNKIKDLVAKMASVAKVVRDHLPGSPVKTGPLTAWNNGGGPGAALVARIAQGLGDTHPVEAATSRLASKIALSGTYADSTGRGAGPGGRGQRAMQLVVGDKVFDAYVRETADNRVNLARAHAATVGRQR